MSNIVEGEREGDQGPRVGHSCSIGHKGLRVQMRKEEGDFEVKAKVEVMSDEVKAGVC